MTEFQVETPNGIVDAAPRLQIVAAELCRVGGIANTRTREQPEHCIEGTWLHRVITSALRKCSEGGAGLTVLLGGLPMQEGLSLRLGLRSQIAELSQ